MTVSPAQTTIHIQRSEWPSEPTEVSHRTQSSIQYDQERFLRSPSKPKNILPAITLLTGLLVGGVVAAVGFTLWVNSLKEITTSTVTTTTSETTSSTSTTTITVTTTTTTVITPTINILWSFNENTNDKYNNYNAVPYNSPTYAMGITGQNNTALFLNGSASQYAAMNSYIDLTNKSFTVELWFYPTELDTGDFGLFGQCQTNTKDLCLIYMIRNYRILMAFHGDDTPSLTTISINRWYHVAFVYDYPTSTQSLYLNGILERTRQSNAYQGTTGEILLGAITNGVKRYFTGYIDEISLMTRTKNADEILIDATLVFYYDFDTVIYTDSGPLNLNAAGIGVNQGVNIGRINSALVFNSSPSYFCTNGLTRLGTIGYAYSISLWIKPSSINGGTIIHVSKCSVSCSSNWCLPFLGLTSNGTIVVQSWSGALPSLVDLTGPTVSTDVWTHIVQTYSSDNGMRLFINGNLYNQSRVFTYLASAAPNSLFVGYFPLPVCVSNSSIALGQYYGLIDEFYLFARDLTPIEIFQLANP